MSRESIADLLAREPAEPPEAKRPRCGECGATLLNVDDRTRIRNVRPLDDENHDLPWQAKQIITATEETKLVCEACFMLFSIVNNSKHFVSVQTNYYAEQEQKRRMLRGN